MSDRPQTRAKASAPGVWQAGWLLARRWVERSAASYLSTALISTAIGLLIFLPLAAILTGEEFFGLGFLTDYFFLTALANLAVNWTSAGYFSAEENFFQKGLSFLRGLPVSIRHLVTMRLLVLVFTLAIMTPLVFVPPYLIYAPVREILGAAGYLSFVVVWASYGFLSGCVNAFLDLGFRNQTMFRVQLIWASLLMVVAVAANLITDNGIVVWSTRLALSNTFLPAALAVVVTVGGACLWFLALERRLKRRDLTI